MTKLKIVKPPRKDISVWDLYLYQNYLLAESLNDEPTKFNILDKTVELRKEGYKMTMAIP